MRKIRSKDTKPELLLRRALFNKGYRYRIHKKELPGKPDIVFPKQKVAVFVHGCFWHYHSECREGRIPSTNTSFWINKLSKNVERDKRHIDDLIASGWTPLVIWECEVEKSLDDVLGRLFRILKQKDPN